MSGNKTARRRVTVGETRSVRLEASIAIHRPPDVVWAFLGDISNLPKWDHGVARAVEAQSARAPKGAGVGYEFHTETHAGSLGNENDNGRMAYRVASVDAEAQRCVVDLTSRTGNARFFRRAEWTFQVTPALSGSRVTCAVEFELRAAYFYMAPVLWLTRRSIARDLAQLKRAIECRDSAQS
jgi:carbon monoxide dehydrogenase subunit G